MLDSFDIKFLMRQIRWRKVEACFQMVYPFKTNCRAIPAYFWLNLINLTSKDTYMVNLFLVHHYKNLKRKECQTIIRSEHRNNLKNIDIK